MSTLPPAVENPNEGSQTEEPTYGAGSFTCPHCGALTGVVWLSGVAPAGHPDRAVTFSRCQSVTCDGIIVWFGMTAASPGSLGDVTGVLSLQFGSARMIWPSRQLLGPSPHADLPEDLAADFREARETISVSPRGACALCRLILERLCKQLVGAENSVSINTDIGLLVKEYRLPVMIQQALDIVRITGNEAVHLGELNLRDDVGTATSLLNLINLIVDSQIAEPNRIAEVFGDLPESKRKGVEARDKKSRD